MIIEKPTVYNILKHINSGIGLDIAKNHTGVTVWYDNEIKTYGFSLQEYDKNDYHAEYKMRKDLKQHLIEIVKGCNFEVCVVEDVYGGENFDTLRKLLALNTVIDEIIDENVCKADRFYRLLKTEWGKYLRQYYHIGKKLKSKVETQTILEYLEFPFLLEHIKDTETEKRKEFFEDICDSCGMLIASVAIPTEGLIKKSNMIMSKVHFLYLETLEDRLSSKGKRFKQEPLVDVVLDYRNLEKSIMRNLEEHPEEVLCAELPGRYLGEFGLRHHFTFYESGKGILLWYYS